MMLRDKVILIVSPQSWSGLWVSKHHYAFKLAERGNQVFFLDPPVLGKSGGKPSVEVIPSGIYKNLSIVRNYISFPYAIKFHLPFLFYKLIKPQIRKIIKAIEVQVDVVWSFDLSDVYPLRFFPGHPLRIYHPVDMPHTAFGIKAAQGADWIFSTSSEILERLKKFNRPSFFIDHGLADVFMEDHSSVKKGNLIRVGYSGNLLRPDIDRECLLNIIRNNPAVVFEFWGTDSFGKASGTDLPDSPTMDFITQLKACLNVVLNGPVPFAQLPEAFAGMDGFLICYDLAAKNPVGPNYHKIMEYLSSGKVIISSFVSLYAGKPELLQMVNDKTNEKLPDLFNAVISNLEFHNRHELREKRKAFAFSNAYGKQLDKIEKILSESISIQ